ncbi:MAG: cupin domain-containing protein [Magnetovibrio sp.]|nr:cupin domain-containing protein [Magnetovibrio sp.]
MPCHRPPIFYQLYWNRRPFVVRKALSSAEIEGLISADELAGLAMEEAPRSRMLKTAGSSDDWSCDYGPFGEGDFAAAGEADWSLLVQNVEQFHPDTADLLSHFDFVPRWLLDDIMVGFSAPGGTVGAHIDTYHVFLIQGQGQRRWKIGREPISDEVYIQGLDFKVLVDGFDGDEVVVESGDVLYIPPKFGHDGVTLKSAVTYSVGLLGPKMSELFSGYGQYLSEHEQLDQRYVGEDLDIESSGFILSPSAVDNLRNQLSERLIAKDFTQWLVEFFTESTHEEFGIYTEREDVLCLDSFSAALNDGASLIKPNFIKFAVTAAPGGEFHLGFDCHSFALDEGRFTVVQALVKEQAVNAQNLPALMHHLEFLHELYNHEALEFAENS